MGLPRVYRLIEGSLVTLFFLQAARIVFAALLSMTGPALQTGQVDLAFVNAHVFLAVALGLTWFAPRPRTALPAALHLTAILVALSRIAISVQTPAVRLYAGLLVMGVSGVYFASLLRANRRSWLSAWVIGLTLEQLFRAHDTYDLSLRIWLEVPVAGAVYRVPWIAAQVVLSLALIGFSWLARRHTRQEPYEPALLSLWGGLAFGGFLAAQVLVLSLPNVVARWAGVPYAGLVPWLVVMTALPLSPAVRRLMGETLGLFAERLQGWVWLVALLMLAVVGNRLSGLGAAGALILAQLMVMLLLWWIPTRPAPDEVEQVGPSLALGLVVFAGLVYAYSLAFEYMHGLPWLRDRGIVVVLVALGLAALPRLFWREDDPWLEPPQVPRGVPVTFIAPVVVFSLLLSSLSADVPPRPVGNTLRIATYNMNSGYDAGGVFQLELAARTIEASLADIVVLQEVDAGRPLSYGVDQVQYLAQQLEMTSLFMPVSEQVHGTAILSRWPLADRAEVLYPGSGRQSGALRGRLEDPLTGRELTVIGTQFVPGSEEERIQQFVVLLGWIDDRTPLALAADLGMPPDVIYEQLIALGMQDPDEALGIERGYTYPALNPAARHDLILVQGLVPLDARQVDSAASDHRLVVIEVGWADQ